MIRLLAGQPTSLGSVAAKGKRLFHQQSLGSHSLQLNEYRGGGGAKGEGREDDHSPAAPPLPHTPLRRAQDWSCRVSDSADNWTLDPIKRISGSADNWTLNPIQRFSGSADNWTFDPIQKLSGSADNWTLGLIHRMSGSADKWTLDPPQRLSGSAENWTNKINAQNMQKINHKEASQRIHRWQCTVKKAAQHHQTGWHFPSNSITFWRALLWSYTLMGKVRITAFHPVRQLPWAK